METITQHYANESVTARLAEAERLLGEQERDWTQLAAGDQFHLGGLTEAQELASKLGLGSDAKVLDLGSGFGGPARLLASEYGSHVEGIEFNEAYVDFANQLNKLTGLGEKIHFRQGDISKIEFEQEFDAAWMLHVGMNIENKLDLYKRVYRSLKPGGAFGVFDITSKAPDQISYPTPWASTKDMSFLVSDEELLNLLREAGFQIESQDDRTGPGIQSLMQARQTLQQGEAPPFNLIALLGETAAQSIGNFAAGLQQGTLAATQIIARKEQI